MCCVWFKTDIQNLVTQGTDYVIDLMRLVDIYKMFRLLLGVLFFFSNSRFLLVIHFIHIIVYMSIPISQFITPPPPTRRHCFPPLVSTFVLYICVSISALQTGSSVPFSRFHISVLIYDICFSLSDLLQSVWQSLDSSMSLQMTQFRSFLWLSNIPLYICTTSSLSIRLSMGI